MLEIVLSLLALAAGFFMLAKGADWFVDGSVGIATKLKIPQLVIGLTIVAMGTSAPEAAVSISAALQENGAITVGNVVGSNILNILIILGISSVITSLAVSKATMRVDIPVMSVATILLLIIGLNGTIVWWEGLIILVVFVSYLAYLFVDAKKNGMGVSEPTQESGADHSQGDAIAELPQEKPYFLLKSILFALVGLALIILGSEFSVEAATRIARIAGLSNKFIGLTIVALGTSLPELFTSVSAALKKNADIAIGNIVGSNIFNILFIVGLSSIITPIEFASSFIVDTIIALLAGIMLFLCALKGRQLRRWGGIVMLLSYVAYFIYIFFFVN